MIWFGSADKLPQYGATFTYGPDTCNGQLSTSLSGNLLDDG
jgi:hypothetical protein